MTPFETFKLLMEMKKHFEKGKFNFHKQSLRCNKQAFDKRKDKYYFEKLSKYRDEEIHFNILALCLVKESFWIRDCCSESALSNAKVLQGWIEGIDYWFNDELKKLNAYMKKNSISYNSLFLIVDDYPLIIKMIIRQEIFFPTFYLILRSSNIQDYYDRCLKDDEIWEKLSLKLNSLDGFIEYDKKNIQRMVQNAFKRKIIK